MISMDINIVLPEITLAVFAMAALMVAVYGGKDRLAGLMFWSTSGIMGLLGLWLAFSEPVISSAFNGSFINDGYARFAKVIILFGSASMLLLSQDYLEKNKLFKFEFPILMYVVASFRRDSIRSTEAGLKYFVLGALSSGLLLYGASLVYGFSGTTNFAGISETINDGNLGLGMLFGLVFLSVGMAFKVSAAPFHMWTPDVYEGSPTPVTGFFATAPKVAAACLFGRVVHDAFGAAISDWQQIIAFLSFVSMFLGAIAAIGQTNIKRLMAYSSIAHMGFALLGLSSGTQEGVQALLIYMAIYVTMNVGVFAFILNMERDGQPITDIRSLGLYSRVEPLRAAALAVLMFSLAGIPPLVGFFGKLYVLKAAINAGMTWLAISAVVASVIGHKFALYGATLIMLFGAINLFGIESVAADAAVSLFK